MAKNSSLILLAALGVGAFIYFQPSGMEVEQPPAEPEWAKQASDTIQGTVDDAVAGAGDLANNASDKIGELLDGGAGDLATTARDKIGELLDGGTAAVTEGTQNATQQISDLLDGQGPTLVASLPQGTDLTIKVSGERANGTIAIDLFENVAPQHVRRIASLAQAGTYDNVVFHRVIDGFMAQTGDVEFGKMGGDLRRAGTGGSDQPDLPAEFSDLNFDRGVIGMARSQNPNSANSQFFIMFEEGAFLNGQYTVVGKVLSGMDVVDQIKRGEGQGGTVPGTPDMMSEVRIVN
jgi:peptidylprolyl isomerase